MGLTGLGSLAVGVCTALILAGCTQGISVAPESMGQVVETNGGIGVRVPALWVDVNTNASGIEPAEVWVNTSGTPGFAIHLDSVQARGAGPAWSAASASAAAVATLISGTDPTHLDVDFTITGPIDGPSAGGILTVGLLAAIRQVPLLPGVSMTGTIGPDGSIGYVLGIPQKLRAAQRAGYHTVIIPSSISTVLDDQTGEAVDVVDYGTSLGVQVLPLDNVQQAYQTFTGQPLLPPTDRPYTLPDVVQATSRSVATDAIERATTALAELPASITGQDGIGDQLNRARALLAISDASAAYGLAVDASLQIARLEASEVTQARLRSDGDEATRQWLLQEIAVLIDRIDAAMATHADVTGLPVEQEFAVPVAMGWLTYGRGVLLGIQQEQTSPAAQSSGDLILSAQAVADQRLGVKAFFPDAMAIVRSMPSSHVPDAGKVATFLNSYSGFLTRAGAANIAYADAVLSPGTPTGDLLSKARKDIPSFRLLTSTVRALASQADAIDLRQESLDQEVIDASTALSHFVASGSLVASVQDFSTVGFGIGEDARANDTASLRTSVDSGESTVGEYAGLLNAHGFDSGYAVWSATWGRSIADALQTKDRQAAGAVLALNEIWYAAANQFWTYAYANSSGRSEP